MPGGRLRAAGLAPLGRLAPGWPVLPASRRPPRRAPTLRRVVDPVELESQVAALLGRADALRSVHEPIVDLRTGSCAGYEALVRVAEWPARSPHPWYTAAARAGLRGPLEAAALTATLRAAMAMPGERFCSVVVSASSLLHPAVRAVLAAEDDLGRVLLLPGPAADVLPGRPAAAELAGLRGRGMRLAIASGEAGRRDLEAVHGVRPDVVVLAGALVRDVHGDPVRRRIVRTVVELADEIGAAVLADAVETIDEVRQLQDCGVRLGRGWLFGRPRPGFTPPAPEVSAVLRGLWAERETRARVGALAVPLPRPAASPEGTGWRAEVDDDGRLVALLGPGGRDLAPSDLVRVRSSQSVRAAAARLLAADALRRGHGVLAVVDDHARFVGLADGVAVLREALAGPA